MLAAEHAIDDRAVLQTLRWMPSRTLSSAGCSAVDRPAAEVAVLGLFLVGRLRGRAERKCQQQGQDRGRRARIACHCQLGRPRPVASK